MWIGQLNGLTFFFLGRRGERKSQGPLFLEEEEKEGGRLFYNRGVVACFSSFKNVSRVFFFSNKRFFFVSARKKGSDFFREKKAGDRNDWKEKPSKSLNKVRRYVFFFFLETLIKFRIFIFACVINIFCLATF